MAQPRIFVSSTCYDLQEIRFQLRSFIEDFGFSPVMSEFGDIFYDYNKHIQDSCKDEIEKSQLFVLIIGNNYGSIYYKQKESVKMPDSVTMQEFRKAIEIDIYKHIFINKYVDYDYKNYIKSESKYINKYLDDNEIASEDIDNTIARLRSDFKSKYPFPQDSYKFIFSFLNIIYDLKSNNAIITYESFEDIKESLRRQWAGFMYDSLTKNETVKFNQLAQLFGKMERIENQIRLLVDGQIKQGDTAESKITFDVKNLVKELNTEEFLTIKNQAHEVLDSILLTPDIRNPYLVKLDKKVSTESIKSWVLSLESIVNKYKWAQEISVNVLFAKLGVSYKYIKRHSEVPYDHVVSLYVICESAKKNFDKDDYNGLIQIITDKFNLNVEEDDDLPF